jgi:cytochrome c553
MIDKPASQLAAAVLSLSVSLPLSAASLTANDFDAALRATADIRRGESLFLGCVACHATDGGGSERGDAPAIAGQYRGVVIRQVVDFRHGKRWDVRMERVADPHNLGKPQDLADVAAYVAAMPVRPTTDHGDGELVMHGGAAYTELCATCHGPAAAGSDSQRIPRMAAQSYQYLLRQMYYTVDNRRPNLAGLHVTLFKRFGRDEFVGVADYLSRLSP